MKMSRWMTPVAYAGVLLGAGTCLAYAANDDPKTYNAKIKVCNETLQKFDDIHIHMWTHNRDSQDPTDKDPSAKVTVNKVEASSKQGDKTTTAEWKGRGSSSSKGENGKAEEGYGGAAVGSAREEGCVSFDVTWTDEDPNIWLRYHWTTKGTVEPDSNDPKKPSTRSAWAYGEPEHSFGEPPSGGTILASLGGGLHTATFDRPQGRIRVNLPDDAAASDTIWGTVIVEPVGKTEGEKLQNTDTLNGYVVEWESAKTPVAKKLLTATIAPAATRTVTTLVLRDNNDVPVARVEVPVKPAPPAAPRVALPTPADYVLPSMGQAGRTIVVTGPIRRDIENTSCTVGDQEAKFLAQSLRQWVGEVPQKIVGPTQIVFKQGGVDVKGPFRVVAVHLSALKTTLRRGEHTTVTYRVEGLNGIDREVPLRLETQGPVAMNGGNMQTVRIQPNAVKPDGTFMQTRRLTADRAGGFSVVATVVVPPAGRDHTRRNWAAESGSAKGGETTATVGRMDDSAEVSTVYVNGTATTAFTAEKNGTNYVITFKNPLKKGDVVRVDGYVDPDKRHPDTKVRLNK